MSSPASILLYGRDHALLGVRTLLFEKAGYEVRSTDSQQEAERPSDIEALDLLVLCHTLNREEQERTMRAVHVLRPTLRGVALTNGHVAPTGDGVTEFVNRFEGPGFVLAGIERLLREQEHRTVLEPAKAQGYAFTGRAGNPEILLNYNWYERPGEPC